jgi:hypothetical protein
VFREGHGKCSKIEEPSQDCSNGKIIDAELLI